MNVKNDISEELRSLSALVATISRQTPYRAPEGYFLSFPMTVLARVQPGLIKTASEIITAEAAKPLTFSVPEGYFEGFAQQVLNRIKAGAGKSDESDLSTGTGEEALPAILVQAGRRTPYSVPEGYFDGLSPILAVLKDRNPYLVPEGYFETLADQVSSKAVERLHPKAKVIGLERRMSWMKYAAAAVVAGLIVTVGWLRWHPATPSTQGLVTTKPVTPSEIASNLTKVSDAELQNYLVDQDTTLAQPVGNMGLMATVDMDDTNLKTLLGGVPEGELKQYIDEQGGTSDIATN
jgi:hypothetical protein